MFRTVCSELEFVTPQSGVRNTALIAPLSFSFPSSFSILCRLEEELRLLGSNSRPLKEKEEEDTTIASAINGRG